MVLFLFAGERPWSPSIRSSSRAIIETAGFSYSRAEQGSQRRADLIGDRHCHDAALLRYRGSRGRCQHKSTERASLDLHQKFDLGARQPQLLDGPATASENDLSVMFDPDHWVRRGP